MNKQINKQKICIRDQITNKLTNLPILILQLSQKQQKQKKLLYILDILDIQYISHLIHYSDIIHFMQQQHTTTSIPLNKPIIYISTTIIKKPPSIINVLMMDNQHNESIIIGNQLDRLKLDVHHTHSQSLFSLSNTYSHFTKVSSTDHDLGQSPKYQNLQPAFFFPNHLGDPNPSIQNLQPFLTLIDKSHLLNTNQHKQFAITTKNILRNISNAQNHFIIFNPSASQIISSTIHDPSKFKNWVNRLKFHTFQEFQTTWKTNKTTVYIKLYKKLCRKFYLENAIPYIINSRIKNKITKIAHIKYLFRFLEGLQNPEEFYYFKQKDKEKKQYKQSI